MALLSQQLQRFPLTRIHCNSGSIKSRHQKKNLVLKDKAVRCCPAIAIDATPTLTSVSGIRWGSIKLQRLREEVEDDLVIVQPDTLEGFSFAAVCDGHGGLSSVRFLRDELFKEWFATLKEGMLLSGKDFKAIGRASQDAFQTVDTRLLARSINWIK